MAVISPLAERQVEGDAGKGEGVAERDEVAGALCGHDAGDAGDGEDVAFLGAAVADRGERFGGEGDAAGGGGLARGDGLGGDIDHPRGAVFVEVGEVSHFRSARAASYRAMDARRQVAEFQRSVSDVAASTWRIRLSPTRKGADAVLGGGLKVGVGGDAAFGDDRCSRLARAWRVARRGSRVDVERLEVAVVDADQAGPEAQRSVEFGLVVHFDQHVHALLSNRGELRSSASCAVVERGDDEQDRVGAVRSAPRRPAKGRP